jgi:hypothetical protein
VPEFTAVIKQIRHRKWSQGAAPLWFYIDILVARLKLICYKFSKELTDNSESNILETISLLLKSFIYLLGIKIIAAEKKSHLCKNFGWNLQLVLKL